LQVGTNTSETTSILFHIGPISPAVKHAGQIQILRVSKKKKKEKKRKEGSSYIS
jgi:hypothetical protein